MPEKGRLFGEKPPGGRAPGVTDKCQCVPFRERPAKKAEMIPSISSCRRPFDASRWPRRESNGVPSMFVIRPPASSMIERAGGDIPGLQTLLPEPVHSTRCDVAEVKSG